MSDHVLDDVIEACHLNDYEGVMKLIKTGIDINVRDQRKETEGWTVLHYACLDNMIYLIEELILRGADLEAGTEYDGSTPLQIACYQGHNDVVVRLLDAGAKVNSLNRHNESVLEMAVRNDHKRTIDILLNRGSNIESVLASMKVAEQYKNQAIIDMLKMHLVKLEQNANKVRLLEEKIKLLEEQIDKMRLT